MNKNEPFYKKKNVSLIFFSIILVAIILLGYLAGSSTFTQPPSTAPTVDASQVRLGPSGIVTGLNCGGSIWAAGSSVVVDPPPGAPFKDPQVLEDLNSDPDIVECNLEAKIAPVNINGVTANLMTYNGYYPGPTILFKKGDILKLNFKNSLPETNERNILGYIKGPTNIHTHGFHVSPKPPSDDPTISVAPGQTFNYVYNTSLNPAGTFNFYHDHIHGLTAEQFWSGLAGSLICEDETDLLAEYETHILFIKDIMLYGDQPAPYASIMDFVVGKEGNIVMVNGLVNPVLNIRPGQVQRWRIVNACNARFLRLSFENHNLQLIGTDGDLLDQPYSLPEMLLSPSERADILVQATQTSGSYKLLSLPYSRGCGGVPETLTLMTVNYNGTQVDQKIPSTLNPMATRFNVDLNTVVHRGLFLSMMGGRGYINGQDFDVNPLTITSKVDTYEVWEITSQCMMDHVFHLHINHFQILSIFGGYPGYGLYTQIPAYKDSVYVPRGGTVRILVRISDFTGMTMFHCHIVEHEDIGMMGMWDIVAGDNETMPMN